MDKINKWICKDCNQQFRVRKELWEHYKTCEAHKLKILPKKGIPCCCKYCNTNFTTMRALREHNKFCPKKPHVKHDWTCQVCNEQFKSRRDLQRHKKETRHTIQGRNQKVDVSCQFCGYKTTTLTGLKNHEKYCINNPKKLTYTQNVHHWTKSEKKIISERMKKLHSEGKAFSWADLSKRKEPSYPEKWLIKVLKNNFNLIDGNDYEREVKFHTFSLDFVFPGKKVIEIDGSQHKRSDYQKDCDKRKDAFLLQEGWKELRIDWSYCYHNTKDAIKLIEDFIKN
jgi:very-short-patch-repair endonuclease